jgi:methyl-accepting chemotaxis protein
MSSSKRVSKIACDLPALEHALRVTAETAEPDFMEIGETLQSLYFDSTRLTGQLQDSVQQLCADSDQSVLHTIQSLVGQSLDEIRQCRKEVMENLQMVTRRTQNLQDLYKMCDEIEKIALHLRLVGINIGIESNASERSRDMFSAVSGEINDFHQKVSDISHALRDEVNATRTRQVETQHDISRGLDHLGHLKENAEKSVARALHHIKALMQTSRHTMENAGEQSRLISEKIGEMVVGLQFHDSMSQIIEHISHALQDVRQLCSDKELPAEFNTLEDNRLTGAHYILRLQNAHIEQLIADMNQVYHNQYQALQTIIDGMHTFTTGLSEIHCTSETALRQSPEEPFERLQAALKELQQIFCKGRELTEHMHHMAAEASEAATRLSGFAQKIGKISFDIKIMALNAIVKAEHLQDNGRPLAILAQEVSRLSDQSEHFSRKVVQTLQDISISTDSGFLPDAGSAADTALFDQGAMEKALQDITGVHEGFQAGSTMIFSDAQAIQARLEETLERLDFLKVPAEQLSDLQLQLRQHELQLQPWAMEKEQSLPTGMTPLLERYTMRKERDVHQQMLSLDTADTDQMSPADGQTAEKAREMEADTNDHGIELFFEEDNTAESENEHETDTADDEEIGDNIELF